LPSFQKGVFMSKASRLYEGEDSIEGWREHIDQARITGDTVQCKCCAGTFKRYRRPLRAALVIALRFIADKGCVSSATMKARGGGHTANDWHTLQYFGLIEQIDEMWSATLLGRRFLAGRHLVPMAAYVEHGTVVDMDKQMVSVQAVCKDSFDLDEIMLPFDEPEPRQPTFAFDDAL
jgi:hypothetical protein